VLADAFKTTVVLRMHRKNCMVTKGFSDAHIEGREIAVNAAEFRECRNHRARRCMTATGRGYGYRQFKDSRFPDEFKSV
jgi:hypothetical protein